MGHYPPITRQPCHEPALLRAAGTTFTNGIYTTLDGTGLIKASDLDGFWRDPNAQGRGLYQLHQGCSGDEGRSATSFVNGFKPGECSRSGSSGDRGQNPRRCCALSAARPISPISYVSSSPTNNPNSYDLWVDFVVSGKTNRSATGIKKS
jgi:hypothetical protein